MEEANKKRLKWGGKVLFLFVWALLTVAVCSAVWTVVPEVALKVAAGALFAANAVEIVKFGKRISKE
jgi:hypothetical protein